MANLKKRAISNSFMNELKYEGLNAVLSAVKNDNTLCMELRGDNVVVYYRGGALFTIKEGKGISYNSDYWAKQKLYNEITENPSVDEAVKNISLYKHQIDFYKTNVKKELEKQGQQQLVLENNILSGNTTGDYFIIDTEYEYNNARFDAIALKWPSLSQCRKRANNLGISFLELKYYDGAMTGKSGIKKHIEDFLSFTNDRSIYTEMCKDMEKVFKQKCELGLIPANTTAHSDISISPDDVDMIFVFINRNPDSTKAVEELKTYIEEKGEDKVKNIFVATSSEMGYVLFRYGNNGEEDRYIPITKFVE